MKEYKKANHISFTMRRNINLQHGFMALEHVLYKQNVYNHTEAQISKKLSIT